MLDLESYVIDMLFEDATTGLMDGPSFSDPSVYNPVDGHYYWIDYTQPSPFLRSINVDSPTVINEIVQVPNVQYGDMTVDQDGNVYWVQIGTGIYRWDWGTTNIQHIYDSTASGNLYGLEIVSSGTTETIFFSEGTELFTLQIDGTGRQSVPFSTASDTIRALALDLDNNRAFYRLTNSIEWHPFSETENPEFLSLGDTYTEDSVVFFSWNFNRCFRRKCI